MKTAMKAIGRIGNMVMTHKGKILAGLAAIAAAEAVNHLIRRRITKTAARRAEEDDKIEQAQEARKAREEKKAQRRQAFQTPQVPKENTIRH